MPDIVVNSAGLLIASALRVAVYSHPGPPPYPPEPGVMPAVEMAAGVDVTGRQGHLAPHGEWWHVEQMRVDWTPSTYGAHVYICREVFDFDGVLVRGPLDVNLDGRQDVFDLLALLEWIELGDARGDWTDDGVVDLFDALEFIAAWE